ncbi:MAG: amino acid transport protein, partial [bacterium]
METAPLLLSFLFGTFGLGYFVYGKKQASWIAMGAGAGLMIYPYFVTSWFPFDTFSCYSTCS